MPVSNVHKAAIYILGIGTLIAVAIGATLMSSPRNVFSMPVGSSDSNAVPAIERAAIVARSNGVDSMFLDRVLESPATTFHDKAVEINVTNFSTKPSYAHNYDARSVRSVKAWMQENAKLLAACEATYSVPAEVVASILWVETKCGTVVGKHHVASVYLSLALCAESTFVNRNVEAVMTGAEIDSTKRDSIRALILTRAERKSRWAIGQLKALDSIYKRGVMDVLQLRGSWAGAFGFSQFIPSSYNKWARDGNNDGVIDLYNTADAATSIANYLVSNGWSKSIKDQRAAVFHYNNSDAYVDAVFTLADKVR